jgi:hypothetical protein
MLFREIIALYSENHAKPINTHYGQNAELLNVQAGGTYKLPVCFKGLNIPPNRITFQIKLVDLNEMFYVLYQILYLRE